MNISRFQKGSLLIEALLSLVILSVTVTVIIQSMTSNLRAIVFANDYTPAIILLDNKLSDLLQKGFVKAGSLEERKFPSPYSDFSYQQKAVPLSSEDEKGINRVTFSVKWPSGNEIGRAHV